MKNAKVAEKRYPIHQCALFAVKSPDQLAKVLLTPRFLIDSLLDSSDNYLRWTKDGRAIQEPKPLLKKIHARVASLLSRIETPDYLHSAIKTRSYITNASVHIDSFPLRFELPSAIKLDIKKFYQSARAQAVYHFFLDQLQCSPDVAGRLTRLLTVDGYLPTGGNASPILSFWAYRDMFDRINDLAKAADSQFSTYIDDMTISGIHATRALRYDTRKIVGSFRLKAHKAHYFAPSQPRVVTGVALTRHGRALPHRRRKLIAELFRRYEVAGADTERLGILNELISRVFEAAQVDAAWKIKGEELLKVRRAIKIRHQARLRGAVPERRLFASRPHVAA